jgi:hypothetical protein
MWVVGCRGKWGYYVGVVVVHIKGTEASVLINPEPIGRHGRYREKGVDGN